VFRFVFVFRVLGGISMLLQLLQLLLRRRRGGGRRQRRLLLLWGVYGCY
jgi:hypothetical protein